MGAGGVCPLDKGRLWGYNHDQVDSLGQQFAVTAMTVEGKTGAVPGTPMKNAQGGQARGLPDYIDGVPVGEIVRALRGIRYGYVQIVVQDSRVIQIERTEKTRLESPAEIVVPGGSSI